MVRHWLRRFVRPNQYPLAYRIQNLAKLQAESPTCSTSPSVSVLLESNTQANIPPVDDTVQVTLKLHEPSGHFQDADLHESISAEPIAESLEFAVGAPYFTTHEGPPRVALTWTDGATVDQALVQESQPNRSANTLLWDSMPNFWPGQNGWATKATQPGDYRKTVVENGDLCQPAPQTSALTILPEDLEEPGSQSLEDIPFGQLDPADLHDAAGSVDLQAHALEPNSLVGVPLSWDWDGSALLDDQCGAEPTMLAAHLRALGFHDTVKEHDVRVEERPGQAAGSSANLASEIDKLQQSLGDAIEVVEGQHFIRTVGRFSDISRPEGVADLLAQIDWGDGSIVRGAIVRSGDQIRVSGAHAYAERGTYDVCVQVLEKGGVIQTARMAVSVRDAGIEAVPATVRSVAGRGATAVVASFRDLNTLGQIDDFRATIFWGDGASTTGAISVVEPGSYDVLGTHTYRANGDYAIRVEISDDGTTSAVISTARVTDPRITARGLTATARAGTATAVEIAAFCDSERSADVEGLSATVDWADGSSSAGTIEAHGNGEYRVRGAHCYARSGSFSVRVTIRNADGHTATTTGTVRVV